MVNELSHRVVVESYEKRAMEQKLTGEWIVFAKHEEKNYYLCLATHDLGDQQIFENVRAGRWRQFPFVAEASSGSPNR